MRVKTLALGGSPKEEQVTNRHWRLLMAVLVGIGVALTPGTLAVWARPNPPFRGHGHDRGNRDHDRGNRDHKKENRGRHRGWERDREGRYRFDSYDRRAVMTYYQEHRNERWFRERGPRGLALAYGQVLAPRYRRYCHPLPPGMLRELPPPPPRFRYFLFGGDVVLFDPGYRVHDFIHIGINIGR